MGIARGKPRRGTSKTSTWLTTPPRLRTPADNAERNSLFGPEEVEGIVVVEDSEQDESSETRTYFSKDKLDCENKQQKRAKTAKELLKNRAKKMKGGSE